MQVLLLQKPHLKSKSKEHSSCLECRLALWQQGDICSLLSEDKCIQEHLPPPTSYDSASCCAARQFDHLMSMGKVSAAVILLSHSAKGGVLSLNSLVPCGVECSGKPIFKTVQHILTDKHPSPQLSLHRLGHFWNLTESQPLFSIRCCLINLRVI